MLRFQGTYDLEALERIYADLPGVESARAIYPFSDGSHFCARRDPNRANAVRYVYIHGEGDCPSGCINRTLFLIESTAPGEILWKETFKPEGEGETLPPTWYAEICG